MQKIATRATWTALALACAGLATWALWPKPVPADLATIARGRLEVTVEDEGITRIRDLFTVSAPIGGKLMRAPLKVGDEVKAGETVVAVIEPTMPAFLDVRTQRINEAGAEAAAAAVQLAEALVQQTRSQLEFAHADMRRARELAEREAASARTLEKAKLDVALAEANLASALATREVRRRELESARAGLVQPTEIDSEAATCCMKARSPVSGRVLRVLVESEQVVQAGASLIELGDPSALEIVVDLLSRDAVRVKQGAAARIENWGGTVLQARIRRVEPTGFTKVSALGIEEQRVKVILDLVDPPERWQRLGHGYRIVARIAVWQQEDVLLVPLGALFRKADSWAVFVVSDGRAHLRVIEIDQRNQHAARVISGLAAGEQVVLHPSDRIQDGKRVVLRSRL
jgi:HlyD family secretion protein